MPTLVEFKLVPTATGTERFADAFRMNDQGWAQQLVNIETYVSQSPIE